MCIQLIDTFHCVLCHGHDVIKLGLHLSHPFLMAHTLFLICHRGTWCCFNHDNCAKWCSLPQRSWQVSVSPCCHPISGMIHGKWLCVAPLLQWFMFSFHVFVYNFSNSSSVSVWLVWYLTDLCFFATGGVVGGGLLLNLSTMTLLSGHFVFLIFSGSSVFPWLSCSIAHHQDCHNTWAGDCTNSGVFGITNVVIFLLSRK